MKKTRLFLSALVAGLSIALASCSEDKKEPAPEVTEVTFEDAALAAFIRQELNIASTDKITRGDLSKLTNLTIRGVLTEVKSLKGIEYATELTTVDFGGNQVTDLTPVKDLKKVTYLRFNETPVTDLSPLKDYTTLTYFNCNQAGGVADISALVKNTGLQEMILRGNPIGDKGLETIANFTKLHRLNLRQTGITNVTVLGQLMSKGALLKSTAGYLDGDSELDLRGNSIASYSPIESYITAGTAIPVSR